MRGARGALLVACAVLRAGGALAGICSGVDGTERAVYRVENPRGLPFLRDYRNDGFRQTVNRRDPGTAEVTVETLTTPVAPRGAGYAESPLYREPAPSIPSGDPGIRGLLDRCPAPAEGYPRLESLLLCGRGGIRVRAERDAPRGAIETLVRGEGSCVGLSRLTVALLRAGGFPARGVSGILFRGAPGEARRIGPELLHRWVEAHVPGTGWVFADPTRSVGYVDARHIVLFPHGPDEDPLPETLRGTRVTLLSLGGDLSPVESRPCPASPGLLLRRTEEGVLGAALIGTGAQPGSLVRLVQEGATGTAYRMRVDGRGTFSFHGLPSGPYSLRIEQRGLQRERRLLLPENDILRLDIGRP